MRHSIVRSRPLVCSPFTILRNRAFRVGSHYAGRLTSAGRLCGDDGIWTRVDNGINSIEMVAGNYARAISTLA